MYGKLSSVLSIPADKISTEESVVALGLEYLLAAEMRSWILGR